MKRTSSLPFASTKRTKSLQRAHTVANTLGEDDGDDDTSLDGPGKVITVVQNTSSDVLSALKHTRTIMFDELPERAGMNSVRIAEVLNFQRNLPAIVSLAHIHALRSASSKTERDIQALLSANRVRRLRIVGRGNEVSGLAELLISTQDYETAVRVRGLSQSEASSFSDALKANSKAYSLPAASLPRSHADALVRAGFLVSPSIQSARTTISTSAQSIVARATISRSASGSQAAVGGEAAFETLGGVNAPRRSNSGTQDLATSEYVLSVPGMAAYLQLLDAGRNHFLDLLRQFSKHRQAPVYLLRERWNGNIDDNSNQVSIARRVRGEFANVLPANTKKWKTLKGLSFDWIMEECLGAGLIELFETYSVGLGVRALV